MATSTSLHASIAILAVAGTAAAGALVAAPAASAAARTTTAVASIVPSASGVVSRRGAQAWSKWYTVRVNTRLGIRTTKCRTHVSVNTGSRIKLRAYIECNRRTDININATGTRDGDPLRGNQRVCISTRCETVAWVNNRKGVQRWCATTWPIINGTWLPGYNNRPRACINY
ncbi:hypothetical protein ACFOY2_35845 [Nonomuraea purpurea]|uniref:Secreted protein n=1 Tax=Nonomuraea purpurea TaxID=1849276 RepID=A0ABV8GIV8_9ACTN